MNNPEPAVDKPYIYFEVDEDQRVRAECGWPEDQGGAEGEGSFMLALLIHMVCNGHAYKEARAAVRRAGQRSGSPFDATAVLLGLDEMDRDLVEDGRGVPVVPAREAFSP